MRILAVSGSLRAISSNTAALQAAGMLAPEGVEIVLHPSVGDLPHFNPDLDTETPPAVVAAWRHEIGRSDGLLICSPEYAHGMAGALKNALDWLVSSLEFADTPTALINTSPRAHHAQDQLREVLSTMSARLVEAASITLPLHGRGLDAAGVAADPALSAQLASAMRAFVEAIGSGRTD